MATRNGSPKRKTDTAEGAGLALPASGDVATAVYDNGRRGSPKPGCDCIQCFGYCIVDQDVAARESFARSDRQKGETHLTAFAGNIYQAEKVKYYGFVPDDVQ